MTAVGWHHNDLSVLSGDTANPAVKPRSPLGGFATGWNHQQHVHYIGSDDHVRELLYRGAWHYNDLTVASGDSTTPAPGSPLGGFTTDWQHQQHVHYIGSDDHIHELFYDGAWHHNDLTVLSGDSTTPAPGSPLRGFATDWNHQQHVHYIGSDNHIHELLHNSGAWHHNDLTVASGDSTTPAPGSPLGGFTTEWNHQQHVHFIGSDNHVHELLYRGAWHYNDLSIASGDSTTPALGSSLGGFATDWDHRQYVHFIGSDNHIHELFYDGGWHYNDLTVDSRDSTTPAPGSPLGGLTTDWNSQRHVHFIGSDNHIHELFYDGGWHYNDLTVASGDSTNPAPGSPLGGFTTDWRRQRHVHFIGSDNDVYELWYLPPKRNWVDAIEGAGDDDDDDDDDDVWGDPGEDP